MAKPASLHKHRSLYAVVICLFGLVAAYFLLRGLIPSAPVQAARAKSPSSFRWDSDGWYWLEGAGSPGSRLIRLTSTGADPVASVGGITAYSAAQGKIVWSTHEGAKWTITLAESNGANKQTQWTGDREPRGLCLADHQIFWLEDVPPAVPGSDPLPPLGGAVRLVYLPVAGGAPTVIATLMEPKGNRVVGAHAGQVFVSTSRPGPQTCTIFYRIPVAGGLPYRIAGEVNAQQSLLTRDGTFYWTADSPEASNSEKIACVRRLTKNGALQTTGDWMISGGKLYETDHGVCYVDGDLHAAAWPLSDVRELPHAYPLPEDFSVLAVGDGQMLLQTPSGLDPETTVYRMALP